MPTPAAQPPSAARIGGDPNVATLLTWFLPGAGHLYLGHKRTALAAFLVIEGLFVLALVLSGGMTFEFLDPELRGPFSTILTPEAGNLGGLLWQLRQFPLSAEPAAPRPFPDTIFLGSWLAALSGMGNVLLMVHANAAGRGVEGSGSLASRPTLLVGLTWLVPGLGHLLQGRRLRGLIVFLLLVGLLLFGTYLAEGSNLSRERHFYYWSGQFLAGLPALLLEFGSGRPPVTGEIPWVDAGLLIGCLAGLLNVLAMLDVYGVAERAAARQPSVPPPAPAAELAPEGGEVS